jgi:hypothetical protein
MRFFLLHLLPSLLEDTHDASSAEKAPRTIGDYFCYCGAIFVQIKHFKNVNTIYLRSFCFV